MCLLREIDRLANDIVLSWSNLGNDTLPFGLCLIEHDLITYGYRIGILYFLEAKPTLEATLIKLLVFSLDHIPASCGFVDDSIHKK